MLKAITISSIPLLILLSCSSPDPAIGVTEITKWKDGKKGAISITLDDGSINQFRQAMPIMNSLDFKGTFYIVTGEIPGSEFQATFLGRPIDEIVKETGTVPINKENFFERASAVRFTGIEGANNYHTQAGALYEQGKIEEAYKTIDEAYALARKGSRVTQRSGSAVSNRDVITWDEIRTFAAQGHEFGNHTVSHPRLAVMDEVNLLYELEKCKEEILKQLGPEHTFSAECPFGTEDERVMEYAYKIHPALRNRMPEPYLEELNRWHKMSPGESNKEYVQWQRGPLSATPMELMKSWVDTLLVHDNVWLVLVFHGVDGIGWEAKPHEELEEYFTYMKERESGLWVATFKDVTKYMRERMTASVNSVNERTKISITLNHTLEKEFYDLPLTLKTYVDPNWKEVNVQQGNNLQIIKSESDERGTYVLYDTAPNGHSVTLTQK